MVRRGISMVRRSPKREILSPEFGVGLNRKQKDLVILGFYRDGGKMEITIVCGSNIGITENTMETAESYS